MILFEPAKLYEFIIPIIPSKSTSNIKRGEYMNLRKSFEEDQYQLGSEAEDFVMTILNENGHNLIDDLEEGKFEVIKNPNKYDIDLLILIKNADKTYTEAYGVEIVRRSSIAYPKIFMEGNKAKYYNQGLPIFFIVVKHDLSSALVLDCTKDISKYPVEVTNFNKLQQNETNIFIPRSEFIEWDLSLEKSG